MKAVVLVEPDASSIHCLVEQSVNPSDLRLMWCHPGAYRGGERAAEAPDCAGTMAGILLVREKVDFSPDTAGFEMTAKF